MISKISTSVLVLVFCIPAAAAAQGFTGVGARAGLNVANIVGDDTEDTSSMLGYHIGLFTNYAFSPSLSFQPELIYTRKGAEVAGEFEDDEDGFNGEFDGRLALDYIELPLLLRVDLGAGTGIRPHIIVGPSLGLNINATAKAEVMGIDFSVDVKDETSDFELGIVAGAGIGFELTPRNILSLGIRYNRGFTTIDSEGDFNNFNSVVMVSGSVTF